MKNLLSYSGFVEENFPKKVIQEEIIKEVIPVPTKEISYNVENLAEVDLLIESAILPEDIESNIGLFQKKKTINEKSIFLYDFSDSKVLGFIQMQKFANESYFEIQKLVSEKNYGPVISDFALMSAYPNGVGPGVSISPGELKVWYYYFTLREDVKKKPIPKDDRKVFTTLDYKSAGLTKEEAQEIINTSFFLQPNAEFQEITKRGEQSNPDKDLAVKKVEKYFKNTRKNG
jgi:hypothetical protein